MIKHTNKAKLTSVRVVDGHIADSEPRAKFGMRHQSAQAAGYSLLVADPHAEFASVEDEICGGAFSLPFHSDIQTRTYRP